MRQGYCFPKPLWLKLWKGKPALCTSVALSPLNLTPLELIPLELIPLELIPACTETAPSSTRPQQAAIRHVLTVAMLVSPHGVRMW
jgi:hypothetical protein